MESVPKGFMAMVPAILILTFATALKNITNGELAAAVFVAAVVAPVVNTGIFLLGCLCFFMPTVTEWAIAAGMPDVGKFMILGLVGGNFLFELLFNIVLSPVIVRLIRLGRKEKDAK